MINGIHHAAISTGRLDRALGFYRDLLGFEVAMEAGWPQGSPPMDALTELEGSASKVVLLRKGNAMLELFEYASPEPRPSDPDRPVHDHGLTHICLDVSDLDTEYERLLAAGMRFHCPPQDFGTVKTTYGRDPDGNVIELQEIVGKDNPLAVPIPGGGDD